MLITLRAERVHNVSFFSDPVQRFYRMNNPPQPSESLEASQVCEVL